MILPFTDSRYYPCEIKPRILLDEVVEDPTLTLPLPLKGREAIAFVPRRRENLVFLPLQGGG
jgi:hypothetical protein